MAMHGVFHFAPHSPYVNVLFYMNDVICLALSKNDKRLFVHITELTISRYSPIRQRQLCFFFYF
jgi:hypothetical protein